MTRTIIFGNSGSGKSTLAKTMSKEDLSAHLDLDTLAWKHGEVPERLELEESAKLIEDFLANNDKWVIEGCYADLLDLVAPHATQAIFMDLPIEACIENAKRRPWEPHKYASKQAQDANLAMLIDWIAQYEHREDTFSKKAHEQLFEEFAGNKHRYTSNRYE